MNKISKMAVKLITVTQIFALALLASCTLGTPVNICHSTGDPAIPYEEITITTENWTEHKDHANDLYPVPVGGCPVSQVEIQDGKITICHVTSSETNPYNEITVSVNGLNGHATHEGDIIPAPDEGCPATLLASNVGKIKICHATGSEKHPYNLITVSVNGLNGHDQHEGDIIPAPVGGCLSTKQ